MALRVPYNTHHITILNIQQPEPHILLIICDYMILDPPLSLCLVFDGLVLADGFAVFHGHLGLIGTHLFALPKFGNTE